MIYLYDGLSYEGQVCAFDFHFNIAWIRFQSDRSLPTAILRQVDDYINVNPAEDKPFHHRRHCSHFNLVPGHPIVAVGRYFLKPFDLMAAPSQFTSVRLYYITYNSSNLYILVYSGGYIYSLLPNSCFFLSSLARCDFDCKELFMGTCKTTSVISLSPSIC